MNFEKRVQKKLQPQQLAQLFLLLQIYNFLGKIPKKWRFFVSRWGCAKGKTKKPGKKECRFFGSWFGRGFFIRFLKQNI